MTTSSRPVLVRTPTRRAIPPSRVPRWLRAILGVPLEQKVLGANSLVLVIAIAVLLSPLSGGNIRWTDMAILFGALSAGAIVSYILIKVALRPVKVLEQIAHKVSMGRVSERVPTSLVADPDLALLAATMNTMLDSLAAGRKRMAALAADVVYAQERERSQVAHDLHDSIGQTLAAASFQVAAAANQDNMTDARAQLSSARELLRSSLEDIRNVSRSLHPRVTEDLGLPTALQGLADVTRQRSLIDVRVEVDLRGERVPGGLATNLYRIAQEALRNIEMHADAGHAVVSLSAHSGLIELEISDDGCAMDKALEKMESNPVLARMRQRLSLAGGELLIHSTRECGTRIIARVRIEKEEGKDKAGEGEAA